MIDSVGCAYSKFTMLSGKLKKYTEYDMLYPA